MQELRKVIYVWEFDNKEQVGYFHGLSDTMQNAVGIIEDVTTGKMHRVENDNFRFVQPPIQDAKSHWSKEHVHMETSLGVDLNKFDSLEKEFKNE